MRLNVSLQIFLIFCIACCSAVEDAQESDAGKSGRSEYAGVVGSYARGGLYGQSSIIAHHSHEQGSGSGPEGCNMDEFGCLSMVAQDRHGLEAIKSLHKQLDDDADGNIDFSESDEFLREDLKYEDGYQRRQQAFHRNDDKHISVRELWDTWVRSEVHNWTVDQTTDWLVQSVELPQYVATFREHLVTGATLPRLALANSPYIGVVLGIKDPIHRQKITLKAMDVVLFGPPKDFHHHTKDVMLVLLVLVVLFGFYYVYRQQKTSSRDMRRMMKDLESLHKAELTLEELQIELEAAKKQQESVATEKLNLERRLLEQSGDNNGMRVSYSDLEVSQLKAEVEMLRNELQRAEGELQDRCWSPPVGLQHWLQITHEIENKSYMKKRQAAEKQLQQAREACEKLRKKRSSLVGAFVSTHGKSIDDVDRSIVEARTSLNEMTAELQERVYRWKQMELLCGFNIINNSGLPYLESVMYRGVNAPNGRGLKGRMSSQDDLDDDSLYTPSGIEGWKEDSSGSEQGRPELDDDALNDTRSLASNVQFTVGTDVWPDESPPIPVAPRRAHKSSMVRSVSQDINVSSVVGDRERDLPLNHPSKSQSESNLEAGARRILPSSVSIDEDGVARPTRRSIVTARSTDGIGRTIDDDRKSLDKLMGTAAGSARTADEGVVDEVTAFRKAVRDFEVDDVSHRRMREVPDDFKRPGREPASLDEFRRRAQRETPEEAIRRLGRVRETNDDDAHSTDSNSAVTPEDVEVRRRKRKLFGHFRKDRSKNS